MDVTQIITLTDVLEEVEYYIEMYENGWLIDNEEAEENPEARKYYRDQVKKMKKFYNKYKKYKFLPLTLKFHCNVW